MHWFRGFVMAAAAAVAPLASAAWSIADLGTFGGSTSTATAINNLGQVVGTAQALPTLVDPVTGEQYSFSHAFISAPNGGALTDLGQLGETGSIALGVNDAGRVVGTSPLFGDTPAGFVTGANGAGMTELGGFKVPTDINNLGQVVGGDGASSYPFITGPNATGFVAIGADQPAPLPWGEPVGINDSGQVAMSAGYLWTQAGGAQALGADVFEATAINEAGQIVGRSLAGGGFISGADGGALQFLATLGGAFSVPAGLNDLGQVVGLSETADGQHHAFVTGAQGQGLTDLELLAEIAAAGWSGLVAVAINDLGQIAGSGLIGGEQHAFLLSPAAPIPEPGTLVLLVFGLAGLVAWRRLQEAVGRGSAK